jgi:hypothetical protein
MDEEVTDKLQAQLLDAMRKNQETIIDAVRQWAEAGSKVTPKLPSVPASDFLPEPEQVMASQFDFAEKLLSNQREFAEQLLGAIRTEKSAE